MNSTTLKQMTKDERLNQWKPKTSWKPEQKFVKYLHTNFLSFLCPQNFSVLFVCRASNFIICRLTNSNCFAYLRA